MNTLNFLSKTQMGSFFCQCPKGVESLLEAELISLGAQDTVLESGGVSLRGLAETFYRILYRSRLSGRLLLPIWSFPCSDSDELYRRACEFPWHQLVPAHRSFMISSHLVHSGIRHSQYASLRLKDAIVDQVRKMTGQRPSVDRENPNLRINLFVSGRDALISLDACGALHQRGYRMEGGLAPLKEHLAASIIHFSAWDGRMPLLDPLCGSGTLLGEALMQAAGIPAGFRRSHNSLKYIPGFDPVLWQRVKSEADASIKAPEDGLIAGSDIHGPSVRKARHNLLRLPHGERVQLEKTDFRRHRELSPRLVVTNLPYGERMGDEDRLNSLYRNFGDFLKKECKGSQAWVLCGSTELVKHIGLRPKRRIPLFNGPIETRLIQLDLY